MRQWNDGSNADNALQNQFTAYLSTAIQNTRKKYIHNWIKQSQSEIWIEEIEYISDVQSTNFTEFIAEVDTLLTILKMLNDRERQVLIARVIEEKSFDTIASELGISYKGAATLYYRTIAKLRKILEVDMQ